MVRTSDPDYHFGFFYQLVRGIIYFSFLAQHINYFHHICFILASSHWTVCYANGNVYKFSILLLTISTHFSRTHAAIWWSLFNFKLTKFAVWNTWSCSRTDLSVQGNIYASACAIMLMFHLSISITTHSEIWLGNEQM